MENDEWYMQYMARYGKFKFSNFWSNTPNYKCSIMPQEHNWMPEGNSNKIKKIKLNFILSFKKGRSDKWNFKICQIQ